MKYEYYHGKKKISADEYIEFLHEQLQSYKQKEEKLREYIENHLLFTENYDFDFEEVNEDILKIINEGE